MTKQHAIEQIKEKTTLLYQAKQQIATLQKELAVANQKVEFWDRDIEELTKRRAEVKTLSNKIDFMKKVLDNLLKSV